MISFSLLLSSYSSSLHPAPGLPIFLQFSLLYQSFFHPPNLSCFQLSVLKTPSLQNCPPSLVITQSFRSVLIFLSCLLVVCFIAASCFGYWFALPVSPQLSYRGNRIPVKSTVLIGFSDVLSMSQRLGSVCKFFSMEASELFSLHFLPHPIPHRPSQ